MGRALKRPVTASWLARVLGRAFTGADREVARVDAACGAGAASLCFARDAARLVQARHAAVVLCEEVLADALSAAPGPCAIACANPRLDFARLLARLDEEVGFAWSEAAPEIHPGARIGRHAVIGRGVRIGEGSVIGHHVVIGDEVVIGARCRIKSGAVIGEEGFGFERAAGGEAVRLPHLGTVRIGDGVEVGSLTTVCRGTLEDTVLHDGCKVDDHVHIAHNVQVGAQAFVIACAEVSGGVRIGRRAWIAPGAAVRQQLAIGDDAVVGLGAVVVRPVEAATTVAGNPARPLPPRE